MVVDPSGPQCHCGNSGCFETFVGERALLRLAGLTDEADVAGKPTGRGYAADGTAPGSVRSPGSVGNVDGTIAVLDAAAAGDPRAQAAVQEVTRWLGRGLASLASILNPAVIVVGGTLTPLVDAYHDDIRRAFDTYIRAVPTESVELRSPGLGSDSSLIGAAEVGFTELLANPVEMALAYRPVTVSA